MTALRDNEALRAEVQELVAEIAETQVLGAMRPGYLIRNVPFEARKKLRDKTTDRILDAVDRQLAKSAAPHARPASYCAIRNCPTHRGPESAAPPKEPTDGK